MLKYWFKMIKATFQSGVALIYNVDDWYELRTKYRIIGEFLGTTKHLQIALPIALCAEEVHLLVTKGIISLVKYETLVTKPTDNHKINFNKEINKLREEQNVLLRQERKAQIEQNIDQIIRGRNQESLPREDVIKIELDKLPDLTLDQVVMPIFTQHPNYLRGIPTEVPISEVLNYTNEVKRLVYEDLWEKGYYLTSGRKFGGDFLLYLGDPVTFHASYIVKCVQDRDEPFNVTQIVACGRLGNSVKKKFVLASVTNDKKVSYLTLSWLDSE